MSVPPDARLQQVRAALDELIAVMTAAGADHVSQVTPLRALADADQPPDQLLRELDREWGRIVAIPGGITDDYVPGDRAMNDRLHRSRVAVDSALSASARWRTDD